MNNMNKKTYMLPGDERIVAGNAEEFVHELRVGSWMDSDCTDERTLCGAGRGEDCHRYSGEIPIRSHTDRICKRNITDGSPLLLPCPHFPFKGKWGFFIETSNLHIKLQAMIYFFLLLYIYTF